jgi:hypothetical protein
MKYTDPARPLSGLGGHPCYRDRFGNSNGEIHFPDVKPFRNEVDYWSLIFHLPTAEDFTCTQRILNIAPGCLEEYLDAFEANPEAFLLTHFNYQVPVRKGPEGAKRMVKVSLEEL